MNGTLRVIGGESDIRFNAALDYGTSSGDFHQTGFRQAAELLLEHFLQDIDSAVCDRDRLVLPILFLFRHYLELRFKEIITRGSKLLGEPVAWPIGGSGGAQRLRQVQHHGRGALGAGREQGQ